MITTWMLKYVQTRIATEPTQIIQELIADKDGLFDIFGVEPLEVEHDTTLTTKSIFSESDSELPSIDFGKRKPTEMPPDGISTTAESMPSFSQGESIQVLDDYGVSSTPLSSQDACAPFSPSSPSKSPTSESLTKRPGPVDSDSDNSLGDVFADDEVLKPDTLVTASGSRDTASDSNGSASGSRGSTTDTQDSSIEPIELSSRINGKIARAFWLVNNKRIDFIPES